MIHFVTDRADHKSVPLLGRVALLTEDAVVAPPDILQLVTVLLWIGQTIWMEALSAQITANEVLLVAKSATQVAHLLKDECWVIKRYLNRIRVPTGIHLIVHFEIFHQI
jgi:hypothetical protein